MKLYIINWQSGEPLIASEVTYPEETAKQILEAWKNNPQPLYANAKWVQGHVAEIEEPQPVKKVQPKVEPKAEEVKPEAVEPEVEVKEPEPESKPQRRRRNRRNNRNPQKPVSIEDIENQKTEDNEQS